MLRRASSTLRPLINRISSLSTRSLGRLPNTQSPIVSKPHFFNSVKGDSNELIPAFRLIDGTGVPLDGAELPELDEALDNILYNVQRQGKISFYMTAYGEEATIIGSAAALADDDEVLGQYREMGCYGAASALIMSWHNAWETTKTRLAREDKCLSTLVLPNIIFTLYLRPLQHKYPKLPE
ncbi:hypothetical protein GG344DRAFT_83224 [Lentinula edodes]|nr:hypothetical protein GG344DRAFT_83224 [Lentinula edodes]